MKRLENQPAHLSSTGIKLVVFFLKSLEFLHMFRLTSESVFQNWWGDVCYVSAKQV